MHKVLQENYYKIDSYLVQTRSQARSDRIKLPEVHGMRKNLHPNIKLEKQHASSRIGSVVKPYIGQGRVGLKIKRSDPINQTINPPSELSQKIPGKSKIETGKTNLVHSKDLMHAINNADTGMAILDLYSQMFLSIQVQFRGPLPNLLYQMCQEVRKVHKVHQV